MRELLDPEDIVLEYSEKSVAIYWSTLCNCPDGMNTGHSIFNEETCSVFLNLWCSCRCMASPTFKMRHSVNDQSNTTVWFIQSYQHVLFQKEKLVIQNSKIREKTLLVTLRILQLLF